MVYVGEFMRWKWTCSLASHPLSLSPSVLLSFIYPFHSSVCKSAGSAKKNSEFEF